jgi:hypothetical protein
MLLPIESFLNISVEICCDVSDGQSDFKLALNYPALHSPRLCDSRQLPPDLDAL